MSLKKEMGEVLLAQGKEMREIKSNLAALSSPTMSISRPLPPDS
jgi:hypothetical protein